MSFNGQIFQFEIEYESRYDVSRTPTSGCVSSKTVSFGGSSFLPIIKEHKANQSSVEVKMYFFIISNSEEVQGRAFMTPVLLQCSVNNQPHLQRQLYFTLQREKNLVYAYMSDQAVTYYLAQSKIQTVQLTFCVYMKPTTLASMKWPCPAPTLWEAAMNKQFTDVVFQVEGKEYAAHKAILCITSPVLAAMFTNDMRETRTGVVNIDDISGEAFEEFLRFLYTGYVKDPETLKKLRSELGSVADKYDVGSLKILCSSNAVNCDEVITCMAEMICDRM